VMKGCTAQREKDHATLLGAREKTRVAAGGR
jgi:hypothetical protein